MEERCETAIMTPTSNNKKSFARRFLYPDSFLSFLGNAKKEPKRQSLSFFFFFCPNKTTYHRCLRAFYKNMQHGSNHRLWQIPCPGNIQPRPRNPHSRTASGGRSEFLPIIKPGIFLDAGRREPEGHIADIVSAPGIIK